MPRHVLSCLCTYLRNSVSLKDVVVRETEVGGGEIVDCPTVVDGAVVGEHGRLGDADTKTKTRNTQTAKRKIIAKSPTGKNDSARREHEFGHDGDDKTRAEDTMNPTADGSHCSAGD